MSKRLGYVSWWDDSKGEGHIIDSENGLVYYVYHSAIYIKTRKDFHDDEVFNLWKNEPVEFTIYKNLYMSQVDNVWPLNFDYSIETEHKLNRLANNLFEINDCRIIDIYNFYYN